MQNERKAAFLKLLATGTGLRHAVECAGEVLGNPILVFDISYSLLAHTDNRVKDDYLWNEIMTTGRFSHETVDFFKEAKFIESYVASPVAYMNSPKLKYARVNAVIFGQDGVQIGNMLTVECYRPITPEDMEFMEIITEYLANEIQKNTDSQKAADLLIGDLIEGKVPKDDVHKKQVKELCGVGGCKANLYVAVVDIIQYEETLTHLIYFKELFKRLKKDYKYFIYLNNIVILFSSDELILNFEREMKELNDFFSKNNIYAGVSSNFHCLFELNTYFKEALNALNYGMSLDGGRHIFCYDIFRIELFLNSHLDEVNIAKLCHPVFLAIREHDKNNNTGYVETLNHYFINGLDAECAAKKMGISRERFKALLNGITKMFQIDLNDGNLLFAIFRSIKLYKCFQEKFLLNG